MTAIENNSMAPTKCCRQITVSVSTFFSDGEKMLLSYVVFLLYSTTNHSTSLTIFMCPFVLVAEERKRGVCRPGYKK
uniref:Uncharacterized protein n=1 Tax=Arundo donax TaxID=35708 RepID=A0A0A9CAD1_ARUDO